MAEVLTRLHDGWVEVILNRPERRNAITGPLADELAAVLGELNRSNTLRVVALRGSEGAFCSGLDIKEFSAEPPPRWVAEFSSKWRAVHRALFDCPHALIGALEKYRNRYRFFYQHYGLGGARRMRWVALIFLRARQLAHGALWEVRPNELLADRLKA